MEKSSRPQPGKNIASEPRGWRWWLMRDRGAVVGAVVLLGALGVLRVATGPVAGARGSTAQALLALAVVLLIANWARQWSRRAPAWSGENRKYRLPGALLW